MPVHRLSCWLLFLVFSASGLFATESPKVIPMELRHNLPFVQVMVNGQGPFTFGIDTGTGGKALVTPDLIQQLGLPVIGEAEVGDPSGRNPKTVRSVEIKSMKLGDVEFNNITAVEFQPSRALGQTDGILGFVLFRDYLFSLDYPAAEIRLSHGSLAPDGNRQVLSFRMPNKVPLIELGVGGMKVDTHIDSRGRGLGIPEKLARDLKFVSSPVVIGRGKTVSSDFEIKGAQLAADIHLGTYTFTRPFVEINPVFPVANFGSIPLSHFAVTFDQKNKLVRFVCGDKDIVIAPPKSGPPPAAPPVTVAPGPSE